MKIQFTRAQAQDAIKAVASHAAVKANIEVLSHIHVAVTPGRMVLTSSDFAMEMSAPVEVECSDTGTFTLPAKRFASLVAGFEKDATITLDVDGTMSTLRCGRGRYQLPGLHAQDFPFIQFQAKARFAVPSSVLRSAFAYTLPAAAVKDIRYYLNGVNLDLTDPASMVAAATDGHRLAAERVFGEHAGVDGNVLLPREAVMMLNAIMVADEVDIELADNAFRATCGEYRLTGKQIDGKFVDWQRVIPRRGQQITLNRRELSDALKRAALFTSEKQMGIVMIAGSGLLVLKTPNDECEEVVQIASGSVDASIPVNLHYLADAVAAGTGEHIGISFGSSSTDSILIHESEEKSTVIMPMRV